MGKKTAKIFEPCFSTIPSEEYRELVEQNMSKLKDITYWRDETNKYKQKCIELESDLIAFKETVRTLTDKNTELQHKVVNLEEALATLRNEDDQNERIY